MSKNDSTKVEDTKPVKFARSMEIISWVLIIGGAILFARLFNNYVIVNADIPSGSMKDTIPEKSRLIAFRGSYIFSDPERLDVIVFKFPDDESRLFVKRIIGMPGDTVEIKEGKVFINGSEEPLDEPYLRETPKSQNLYFEVPEGKYFVMGDNRNESADAREWTNKYLEKEKILGKAVFGYFPKLYLVK